MEMTGSRIAVSAASEMSCNAIVGRMDADLAWRRRTSQLLQRAAVTATQTRLQSNSINLRDYTEAIFSLG